MNYIFVEPTNDYKDFKKNLALGFSDDDYIKIGGEATIIMDEFNEPLLIYLPNEINDDILVSCYNTFEKVMKKKLDNRGAAAGMVEFSKLRMSRKVAKLCPKLGAGYRSKYVKKDGQISKRTISNAVASCVVGYIETKDLQNWKFLKGCKRKQNEDFICRARLCAYSRKNKNWTNIYPLVEQCDAIFKNCLENEWNRQKNLTQSIKSYVVNKSVYSTITINNNFQTYLHTDANNIKDGYSCMVVDERKGEKYSGFNLLLPRYRLSVDIRKGDIVFFKSREYHCNSDYDADDTYERISYVLYLREKLLNVLDIKNCHLIIADREKEIVGDEFPYCKTLSNFDKNCDYEGLIEYCKDRQYAFIFLNGLVSDEDKMLMFSLPRKCQIIINCLFDFTTKEIKTIQYKGYRINFIDKGLQKEYYLRYSKISHYCLYYENI